MDIKVDKDIVERLRAMAAARHHIGSFEYRLIREAADVIDELRFNAVNKGGTNHVPD